MKKFRTIRFRMFLSYAAVLMLTIAAAIAMYISRTYIQARSELSETMNQLAENIASGFDVEVRQLSLVSEKIVFSQQIREAIINELPVADGAARYRISTQLNSLLYSICGPKLTFYHINIISVDGYQYAFGQDYRYTKLEKPPADIFWFPKAVELDGKALIVPLYTSETNSIPKNVASVCRGFGIVPGLPIRAVVEVQRDYDYFVEFVEKTAYLDESRIRQRSVYIFDESGGLVYPVSLSGDEQDHYRELLSSDREVFDGRSTVLNPVTKVKELLFLATGSFSGWNVIVAPRESYLADTVRLMMVQAAVIGILLLIAAAFMSFFLSRKFTIPIEKLRDTVQTLNLEGLYMQESWRIDSGVDELEQLGTAFSMMTQRLHASLDEMVELKNAEMHSRMLALQAQMNPHFLYNTLTVVSIMAEEGETKNVQWACRNLSNMLEYISSDALKSVTLREEIRHAQNYMDLILIRYMEDVNFQIDVPDDILHIKMPKLVIQPLLENSVKYATEKPPVWRISLSARIQEGFWRVCVSDNGNGFKPNVLSELYEKIRIIRDGGEIPSLSLNGMGILNIFLRLYYEYHQDMIFEIDNNPGKGASITVGGRL